MTRMRLDPPRQIGRSQRSVISMVMGTATFLWRSDTGALSDWLGTSSRWIYQQRRECGSLGTDNLACRERTCRLTIYTFSMVRTAPFQTRLALVA